MRLSRNRNWGHPNLIKFLERFAEKTPKLGWGHGLLVGDLAQPRGGPMLTGHWSHQVGLDADIWFTPMPDRELTRQEREEMSATNIVADDWKDVNPKIWSPAHITLLHRPRRRTTKSSACWSIRRSRRRCAATSRRPFLAAQGPTRVWPQLSFPRPHQLSSGQDGCKKQPAAPADEGCGKDLDWWFKKKRRTPSGGRPPIKMSALPAACKHVLLAE